MLYKYIHFIGIKGVAMTALAIVAKEQGSKVTGSDIDEDFPTKEILEKYKIKSSLGFSRENIKGKPDLVIVTGAHQGMNNPEAQAAKNLGLKVLMHAQALSEFINGKKCLAIAGNHGKTTTAAILAHILVKANLDPSFAIGCGQIKSLSSPGHAGRGDYFVVEADEYITDPNQDPTPRFLWLKPEIAIITNIDFDHPDVYKNIDHICQSYASFCEKIVPDGLLIANIDNQCVRNILKQVNCKVITYGFSPSAEYQIQRVYAIEGHTWFHILSRKLDIGQFSLAIPGKFNVANALAASVAANYIGISWDKIKEALSTYEGTMRRFEKIKELNGAIFYDDYAHHPDQIKNTLQAARSWYPDKKIICIFQPHTYSRTKALFSEFARSFSDADEVIITDIYSSAREKPDPTVSSQLLSVEVGKYHPKVRYIAGIDKIANYLQTYLQTGNIIITMGAGDIYKLHNYF
ncbi:MAG: UDP-N-acetylmuramate--L-alanine ligase [Candidatus Gottesmanbacteria bacterium]